MGVGVGATALSIFERSNPHHFNLQSRLGFTDLETEKKYCQFKSSSPESSMAAWEKHRIQS